MNNDHQTQFKAQVVPSFSVRSLLSQTFKAYIKAFTYFPSYTSKSRKARKSRTVGGYDKLNPVNPDLLTDSANLSNPLIYLFCIPYAPYCSIFLPKGRNKIRRANQP
jgi:hypothetical protein